MTVAVESDVKPLFNSIVLYAVTHLGWCIFVDFACCIFVLVVFGCLLVLLLEVLFWRHLGVGILMFLSVVALVHWVFLSVSVCVCLLLLV